MLNVANEKTDEILSDFQTVIGAAAYATLDTNHLISCTRTALVDNIASLKDYDGAIILFSEVPGILTFWTMLRLNGFEIQHVFGT